MYKVYLILALILRHRVPQIVNWGSKSGVERWRRNAKTMKAVENLIPDPERR